MTKNGTDSLQATVNAGRPRGLRKADVTAAFPDHVLVRRCDYEKLVAAAEDAADARALADARAAGVYLPDTAFGRILDGEHPLRVWRRHRGLTLEALAGQAGVGKAHLSHIETGRRKGTTDVLGRCAKALGVSIDDLVP